MENLNSSCLISEIFLVAGGTSHTGIHIIKTLLEKKKRVRLLLKDLNKFNEVLSEEERNKIDKIIICDLIKDIDFKQKLADCYKTEDETNFYVISAFSIKPETFNSIEQGIYITNKRLIDSCVQSGKVKKISFVNVNYTLPHYSFLTFILNRKLRYVKYYSNLAEDYLRKSGLDYLIIRPVGLIASEKAIAFSIYQGENVTGHMNTASLGRIAVDTLLDVWIKPCVTFECVSQPDQINGPYYYIQGSYRLRDDYKGKEVVSFRANRRLVIIFYFSGFMGVSYYLFNRYSPGYLKNILIFIIKYAGLVS
jgi:hypothetical protein